MFGGSVVFAIVHLGVGAAWFGSMTYSLFVVQPAVAKFFGDEARREEFLVALAQGNRYRVVALVSALLLSGLGVVLTAPGVRVGFVVAVALEAVAAAVFVEVSWRHWPARVFATAEELPAYQRALRVRATAMVVLVGIAFALALVLSVAVGVR